MTVTAGNIMDRSAALLSDPAKITFTYLLQLPFLLIAWDELQEELVSNGITDVDEVTSAPINVDVNTKILGNPGPPDDMLFPIDLWERADGGAEADWVKMVEKKPDPSDQAVESLDVWYWEDSTIKFRGATTAREVKIYYQKELITIDDDQTAIPVTNCKSFLSHRTAALIAETRGNRPRAQVLHARGDIYLAKAATTKVKDMQEAPVRPKRYGFSRRANRRMG